jgi:uncharacterized OsmC-like protein
MIATHEDRARAGLHLRVEHIDDYEFRVRFDDPRWHEIVVDEGAPLGRGAGPDPVRLLGAAVADCICASFFYCARKAGLAVGPLDADVTVDVARNDEGRLRVSHMKVTLHPTVGIPEDELDSCVRAFEDYCVVSQSVRSGIQIEVAVEPTIEGPESASS